MKTGRVDRWTCLHEFMLWDVFTMKNKFWRSVRIVIMAVSVAMPQTAIAEEATKEEAAKINELIEELASPNDANRLIPTKQYLKFPPDWDHAAQGRVGQAATSLAKMGITAFPLLIEHASDERFSFVSKSGNGAMRAMPVGDACGRIIEVQLDVFEQIGIYPRMYPSYFGSVVKDEDNPKAEGNDSLKKWWEERKDKSLVELQIESFEWAIEQQTQLLGEWKADKRREKDDLKNLQQVIAENKNGLGKLRNTKQPIQRSVHPFKIYEGK